MCCLPPSDVTTWRRLRSTRGSHQRACGHAQRHWLRSGRVPCPSTGGTCTHSLPPLLPVRAVPLLPPPRHPTSLGSILDAHSLLPTLICSKPCQPPSRSPWVRPHFPSSLPPLVAKLQLPEPLWVITHHAELGLCSWQGSANPPTVNTDMHKTK